MFKVALPKLQAIQAPSALAGLPAEAAKDLQRGLILLGHLALGVAAPFGMDGDVGKRTKAAQAAFLAAVNEGGADTIGPDTAAKLLARCQALPSASGVALSTRAETIAAIRQECAAQGIGLPAQIAYVLATVEHETAKTFLPVREAYYLKGTEADREAWRKAKLAYHPYYGRGYVQLTHKPSYERYGALLGLDLAGQLDLALDPHVSLFVLVHGFKTGGFSGARIETYISKDKTDFVGARRCINGQDKAEEIAALAEGHLTQGG